MALVDLRGRVDEDAVLALLALAHGDELDAVLPGYRAREWGLVGWAEDEAPVACAGVERLDGDELRLRAVAVAPDRRGRGIGRALLDAVAGVATARRLVAEADRDGAEFLRRCGFAVGPAGGGRFRCTRALEGAAADDAGATTLAQVEDAIRASWGRDTAESPDEWSQDNPAAGQCGATALVVRDLLGGEILLANVLRDGVRVDRHAWNRLPSGLAVDLTREQFRGGETFEQPCAGEPAVASDRARADLLAARVRERLGLAARRGA
jgi:GNAT superfamily N-acetyltransferase